MAILAGCTGSSDSNGDGAADTTTTPTDVATTEQTTRTTQSRTDYTRQFRGYLQGQVDVDYLGTEGNRAVLDHYSDEATPGAIGNSMGQVAVTFSRVVDSGWEVSGLDGTVLNEQGEVIATYRIESNWVSQYNEGTIDSDTLVRKMTETLDIEPGRITTSTPEGSDLQGPTQENRQYVELQFRNYTNSEVAEIKDSAQSINYRDLFRNVESYQSEAVTYTGTIWQTLESQTHFTFLIAIENDPGMLIYASWTGDRFIQNDRIRFWGEVLGIEIYETGAGSEKTVPAIAIADIELLDGE